MRILLWLVFPAVATLVAMLWAGWSGRPQRAQDARESAAAYERFAAAVRKPHPTQGRGVSAARVERATGIAVRRPRPGDATDAAPRTSGPRDATAARR
ncbi:MAG: hypothetical protein GEU93_01745 [Propionibacteriales bacterium]|nr:hypothetical protein [Propionibacteriales bacterium]